MTVIIDAKTKKIKDVDKWRKGDKVGPETKINKDAADKIKDKIKEWKRKEQSKMLEENLDKAGYSPRSLDEFKSGSEIGSIDTAGRIRQGIKKGGRVTRKRSTGVATHGFGKEIR